MNLNKLLDDLKITCWDLLLMGDGSGTGYNTPVGYSAVSVDRVSGTRLLFVGGANRGTIGQAELLPYLNALRFDFYKNNNSKLVSKRRVVILSDSQVSVNVGNGDNLRHTNQDIWVSFDWFKSVGYEITWRWVGRNENDIHILAHDTANAARKAINIESIQDIYSMLPTEGSYTVDPGSDWGFEVLA